MTSGKVEADDGDEKLQELSQTEKKEGGTLHGIHAQLTLWCDKYPYGPLKFSDWPKALHSLITRQGNTFGIAPEIRGMMNCIFIFERFNVLPALSKEDNTCHFRGWVAARRKCLPAVGELETISFILTDQVAINTGVKTCCRNLHHAKRYQKQIGLACSRGNSKQSR